MSSANVLPARVVALVCEDLRAWPELRSFAQQGALLRFSSAFELEQCLPQALPGDAKLALPGLVCETGIAPQELPLRLAKLPADAVLCGLDPASGLALLFGAAISPDMRLDGIGVSDLKLTLSYCLDQELPANLDGRVLLEIFAVWVLPAKPMLFNSESFPAAKESGEPGYALDSRDQEMEDLYRSMQSLGYL